MTGRWSPGDRWVVQLFGPEGTLSQLSGECSLLLVSGEDTVSFQLIEHEAKKQGLEEQSLA